MQYLLCAVWSESSGEAVVSDSTSGATEDPGVKIKVAAVGAECFYF